MPKKDEEMSVSSEAKGPLKSFQALMGEGEKFSRDKLYIKAIQCYTEALDLIPQDDDKASQKDINDRLNGLVARSACYLKIGKNDLALNDAEESLKSNKEFTKGLYQKAEALYAMGEFELALMFYHRGKKLRPDLREFQLGINKAQEAIDNSVGDPNRVKLEASGDLSIFYKNDEDEAKKKKKQPMGYVRASQKKETAAQRKQHPSINNPKTTKQLLGDLYEDRVFLDKIINNGTVTKPNTKSGDAIYQLASEGIDYLDSRTDFWRQQEPIYARARATKKPEGDGEIYRHIHRELEAIDNLQNNDQFVDARRRAQHLVDFCERIDERKFSEKQSVLADVYSRLGNAYLELGDYNRALEYHNRDLRIAETKNYTERRSRALDNLGRVYARSGQFPQAIQVWERKVPLATSPLEKAWLFHEIDQCQFGLGDYEKAKRYGERSYNEAVAADDAVWQLNAKVLIAHSQTKLRQYREAEQTFNEALTLARDQNDVAAERAIERAIKDVRDQIDKGAADSPPDRPETNYDVKVKSTDNVIYADENLQSTMHLAIFGDNGSSGPIDLNNTDGDAKKLDVRSLTLKRKAFDAGKLTKLAITYDNIDSWPLEFIEVTDTKRKNKVKFLLPQPLESIADTVDLYPEGCIVPPSLALTGREDQSKKKSSSRLGKKDGDSEKSKSKPVAPAPAPAYDPNKKIDYTVTVQTGNVSNAGTDAKVFLTLNGDRNKLTKRALDKPESGQDPFEKNGRDVFKFNDTDIGKLKTITIEHDDSGMASAWYLETVEVKCNNDTTVFPVGRWLDKKEGDKRISLDLEPNKRPASKTSATPTVDPNKSTPYVVTVHTGNVSSGGTDAKVFITLNGDKNKITRRQLQKPEGGKDPFEKGNKDVFKFDDIDIGKLKTITIAHDDGGMASGWFLDWVEVKVKNDTTMFPVDRWLDKDEDDGKISLDLEPNKKPTSKSRAASPKSTVDPNKSTPYEVTVQTGNVPSSGTDAKVFITLNGDKTKIGRRQLEKPEGGKDPFEKGNKDVFKFDETDIGQLKTITIEHDGSGLSSAWFLDWVEVKVKNNATMFPVGRWLAKDEEDGKISLDLEPNKKPPSKATAEPPKPAVDPNKNTPYVVTVQTGSKTGSGTDAKVFISLNGDKNKISKHQLQKPEGGADPFETGKKDVFKFDDIDVGKLQTINIEHDGKSFGAGWFVDSIEVKVRNDTYTFPVDRWLDTKEDDGKISLELEPNKKPESKTTAEPPKPAADTNKGTSYVITVQTGNVQSGGTDSKVLITLNGEKSKITKYHLQKSETNRDPFEKGAKDVFKFNDIDVGKLKTIVIEHDDSGLASGWFLDSVEVKVNNDTTLFPVGRWLDKQEDDGRISLELEPNKKPASKATTEPPKPPSDPNKQTPYVVTIQTGSVASAGTNANVYLTLNGDKNKITRRQLQKPESGKDPFEKGNKDVFKFDEMDIGKLKTIVIEHDGSGIGAGWFLDSVEVKVKDETTMFPVGRWLDVGEDDKRISLELEPNKKPTSKTATDNSGAFDATGYDVTVRTGNVSGAGTDANVYLSLHGDKTKLERYQLKQSVDKKGNLFERGSTDRFRINTTELGNIKTIRIEHDGRGIGAGWFLDSIEIVDVAQEKTYKFPVDRWLDAGEGDKRISLDLEPDKKPGQLS